MQSKTIYDTSFPEVVPLFLSTLTIYDKLFYIDDLLDFTYGTKYQRAMQDDNYQENLRRDISSLLKDFEKNREWADFSHWLHKLLDTLGNRKSSFLPHELTLAKRLAQCLNPSLPAGVHSTALKVYQTLLNNYGSKTYELLPLMAMGLFPFFEHSNTQNKYIVLKLFEEHFISDAEGVQMVVGLTNALLTVLNETYEDQAKRVYSIFESINKNFGRLWVDGAVWVNILKSPKVRMAGFKYFQKVFRDRDRAAQSEDMKMSLEEEKTMLELIEKKVEDSMLGEEQKVLLTTIYGFKCQADVNATRFPNFSSLVVNSLSVCLEVKADNMVKRAALDLLLGYLRLGSGVFGRKQGVLILEKMLLLLQSKEYSLTNRVYKYLFGQPNSDGFFHIDFQTKQYELSVLKEALANLLQKDTKDSETVLLIMEIIIGDHSDLANFLLQRLAVEIVTFSQKEEQKAKKSITLPKTVADFYLNIIVPNRRIFVSALLNKIPKNKQEIDPLAPEFPFVLDLLKYYFRRMEKLSVQPQRKGSEEGSEDQLMEESKERIDYLSIRVQTLRDLIEQLWSSQDYEEQQSLRILDLCNQLLAQIHIICEGKEEGLSREQIEKVQKLLVSEARRSRKTIYAKLLTLHPKPTKQMLLPYIEDSCLSIVCINILLGGEQISSETLRPRTMSATKNKNRLRSSTVRSTQIPYTYGQPMSLTLQEQQAVFFSIFKLLNCHLFEARALEFIDRFRAWWGSLFVELINKVEPSEWLIYWKKMEGDVSGGILRMVQNLSSQNSYHKHLSKKWISEAENIITKVLDAIYLLLQNVPERKDSIEQEKEIEFKQLNVKEYERVYNLIQLVFKFTTIGFTKFFFLQKDKYLAPLVLFAFKCLQSGDFPAKSRSLSVLSFILNQATEPRQKIDLLTLTLPNVLALLDEIMDHKKVLGINTSQSDEQILKNSNFQIELLEFISLGTKRVGQIQLGEEKVERMILECLNGTKIEDVMLKGITFTDSQYIKNLYIESSKQLAEMLAKVDRNKKKITNFISRILDKLFFLLKNTDANRIQTFIKNRNETSLKDSIIKKNISVHEEILDVITSISKETALETEIKQNLNLQEKYGEIVELWNTVKYYLQFALTLQLKEIPITNLLSLALSSFPLAYLRYTCVGSQEHANNLQILEEEIQNVTGLKKEVFQIFEILWNKENKEIIDFLVEKGDPRILVHSQVDPSKVLDAFNRCSKMVEVKANLKTEKISLPKNMLYYNIENLIKENQLLFFIYLYLLYCNFRLLKNKRISSFFDSLLELLHKLCLSSHIQTKIWVLQLMEVIGHRIVNTKELSIENGNRIRNQLQHITRNLIEEIQAVITKSKHFTHKMEIKSGIFSLFNKEERQHGTYDFVKNFPPTICQQFEHHKENIKKHFELKHQHDEHMHQQSDKNSLEHPRDRLSSYLLELDSLTEHQENPIDNFLFQRFVNIPEDEFPQYLSYVCLRTLIRIGNSVLIALFDDLVKISIIVKEVLLNLLPICENRDNSNMLINQLIAEYLHTVLANETLRTEVLRNLRKQIIEVYMTNNFFKCTQKTLAHWKAIIDFTIGQNNDLLGELLSREGLFQGIFTRKAEATRQKIKSFERVCFIIYAGRVDRYENKLRVVLESLNEVMKQDDAPPALLILILFCIRILLMRLSAISLNKLFKSVWPSLITLLTQIFSREKGGNVNLQLAALKVVELIHAMELEEFMLHKWMFIFDYFGLKIDPMGQIQDNMPSCQMLSPFRSKPQLTHCFPNKRYRCKFVPEKAVERAQGVVKRRLIVKRTYVDSEEDLQENALLLMQYMMDLNESRCEMSKEDIENLIQDEFISLDDYIFKVK